MKIVRQPEQDTEKSAIQKVGAVLQAINQSRSAQDITNWLGHGATELANMNIHGHAAPMYAHGGSPAEHGSPYGQDTKPQAQEQGQEAAQTQDQEPRAVDRHEFYQLLKKHPDMPDGNNMVIDMGNVAHSDPISPGHTPGHTNPSARLAQARAAMDERMNTPQQSQDRGMER